MQGQESEKGRKIFHTEYLPNYAFVQRNNPFAVLPGWYFRGEDVALTTTSFYFKYLKA